MPEHSESRANLIAWRGHPHYNATSDGSLNRRSELLTRTIRRCG